MIASKEDIENFLNKVKSIVVNASNFDLILRDKNIRDMATINFTTDDCRNEIMNLNYTNYESGPTDERDPNHKGTFWIFGKCINSYDFYIKLKIALKNGIEKVACLSFHIAEHPLRKPYNANKGGIK
jgi:hypothetical protein